MRSAALTDFMTNATVCLPSDSCVTKTIRGFVEDFFKLWLWRYVHFFLNRYIKQRHVLYTHTLCYSCLFCDCSFPVLNFISLCTLDGYLLLIGRKHDNPSLSVVFCFLWFCMISSPIPFYLSPLTLPWLLACDLWSCHDSLLMTFVNPRSLLDSFGCLVALIVFSIASLVSGRSIALFLAVLTLIFGLDLPVLVTCYCCWGCK